MLQKLEAEQILVEEVNAASGGVTNVTLLQQRMAHVCIRNGLKPLAHGFQLEPILLHLFGCDASFKSAKAVTGFASTKLKRLIDSQAGPFFSIINPTSVEKVALHITKLVPNPSPEVCALLPTVAWLQPAGSGSSSSDFLSPSSSNNTSVFPDAQADQELDPVYTMLDLLPPEITSAVKQQLGLGDRGAIAR